MCILSMLTVPLYGMGLGETGLDTKYSNSNFVRFGFRWKYGFVYYLFTVPGRVWFGFRRRYGFVYAGLWRRRGFVLAIPG